MYNAASVDRCVKSLAKIMNVIKYILLISIIFWSFSVYSLSPESEEPISLEQAANIVKKRTGGEVLSAEKRRSDGRLVYRIKILTPKGRVRSVYIDPLTER